jgi:hypothetical protein
VAKPFDLKAALNGAEVTRPGIDKRFVYQELVSKAGKTYILFKPIEGSNPGPLTDLDGMEEWGTILVMAPVKVTKSVNVTLFEDGTATWKTGAWQSPTFTRKRVVGEFTTNITVEE